MSGIGDDASSELRIARAFGRLLGMRENAHGTRIVLLERIGNYEIRMFEPRQTGSAEAPLFWIELFDHVEQSSLDSCGCYVMEDAIAAFETFVSNATCSDEHSPCGDHESQN